jgi:hypothetical protein
MRRKIGGEPKRRLRRLEIAEANSNTVEIWITQNDGTLRCQSSGERMTRKAFSKLYPNGTPNIMVFSAIDAKL